MLPLGWLGLWIRRSQDYSRMRFPQFCILFSVLLGASILAGGAAAVQTRPNPIGLPVTPPLAEAPPKPGFFIVNDNSLSYHYEFTATNPGAGRSPIVFTFTHLSARLRSVGRVSPGRTTMSETRRQRPFGLSVDYAAAATSVARATDLSRCSKHHL